MPFAKFSTAALLCSLSLCAGAAMAQGQASPAASPASLGTWSFTVEQPPSSGSAPSLEPTMVSEVASHGAGWTVRTKRLEAPVPAKPFFSASGTSSGGGEYSTFKVTVRAKDGATGAPFGSDSFSTVGVDASGPPGTVAYGVERGYLSSVEYGEEGMDRLESSVVFAGFSATVAPAPGRPGLFKVFSSASKLVRMEQLCVGESKPCVQLPTTSSASAATDDMAFEPGREVLVGRLLLAGSEEERDPKSVVYEVYARRVPERVAAN